MIRFLLSPKTLAGAAVGAWLAWLLDPDRGRARRAQLRDQAVAKVRRTAKEASRQARYAEGRLAGALHDVTSGPSRPADRTVVDKVRSEVLRDERWKGHVNVEADGHKIVLRGALDDQALIDELEDRVHRVDGVEAVESFLHVTGTPAPNTVRVLRGGSAGADADQVARR